ncbi:BTB/POZ domain-containing protein 19 isoform X2 [Manis pentadactyla]|uniref:BTB/POZ domain-containing protein 19 isoform X2 n=1 Tax=Manis pentadactyla TaxID=143292 RepID=UPI00255C906E|nr:BTB/POZ domain-containing protein 19 isoform X2 [Manis pentadactyla]
MQQAGDPTPESSLLLTRVSWGLSLATPLVCLSAPIATPPRRHFRHARTHDISARAATSSPDLLWEGQDCPLPNKPVLSPEHLAYQNNWPPGLFHLRTPLPCPTHGGPRTGCTRGDCTLFHSTPESRQQPPLQVLEVLTAAVEYGLEELRELCLEFVVQVLDVDLVCEALQVAVTFGLGPLQERCIGFIEAHSQEALRTRGFLELSAPALLPLLRSDELCVDEAELVVAARNWARVGAAVLERSVAEVAAPVVRELRLALLAPPELSALEEQNRQEPLIPVEQIVEAWKCHALRRGYAARSAPCRRRKGTVPREHHRYLDLPFK